MRIRIRGKQIHVRILSFHTTTQKNLSKSTAFSPISLFLPPLNKLIEEMTSSACSCSRPLIVPRSISPAVRFGVVPRGATSFSTAVTSRRSCRIKASIVDSYESSSNFVKRMEQTWLISQQPRPVSCSSCESNGHVECKWCRGTGFFILGDNMLCQVPSRNTTCVICAGKGSTCCSNCKGTGFRAKWLGEPPTAK